MDNFNHGYNVGTLVMAKYEFSKAVNQLNSMANCLIRSNKPKVFCEGDYKEIEDDIEKAIAVLANLRKMMAIEHKEMA